MFGNVGRAAEAFRAAARCCSSDVCDTSPPGLVTPHHRALWHSQHRTCGEEVAWFVLRNQDLVANT